MRTRAAALLGVLLLGTTGCTQGDLPAVAATCEDLDALALVAQAVPEAASIPCFPEMPYGFRTTTFDVESGRAQIALSHAVVGLDVAVFTIGPRCATDPEGRPTPTPPAGQRVDRVLTTDTGGATGTWVQGLGEACMVVQLQLDHPDGQRALADLEGGWTLLTRPEVAAALADASAGRLQLPGGVSAEASPEGAGTPTAS